MKTRFAVCLAALLMLLVGAPTAASQTFTRAQPGYRYSFPRDHFSHPEYQTEWWYYTGNLRARDGHRFGFELTFFREGLQPSAAATTWNLRDIYMAHLALSDLSGHRYYTAERLNRAGPGIAGVDAAAQTVWNGNWQAVIAPGAHQLRGVADTFALDLRAVPRKAPVVHGDDGLSRKSAEDASHYISFTRMVTDGTLKLNGETFQVEGDTWMDHEFFTNASGGTDVGWDWISIQLDDATELMLYRLRHKDGTVDPFSSGSYIDRDGRITHLALADFTMTAGSTTWRSVATSASYPLAWTVTVPKLQLTLTTTTPLQNQEFVSRFGPSYWEGAIAVSGTRGAAAVHGSGYLELTGYTSQSKLLTTR